MTKLLGIFTLDKSQRIRCQHENCTKTVYAKIHLLEHENKIIPVGSTCFKKYFYEHVVTKTVVSTHDFGLLSESEKAQILNNTAQFLKENTPKIPWKTDVGQYENQELKEICKNHIRREMYNSGMNPDEPAFNSTYQMRWKMLYHFKEKKLRSNAAKR